MTHITVWGLGPHAIKNILPALASIDELTLYGVCSRNKDTVVHATEQWNCKAWTNPDEMLADQKVDVVYLATPIGLHAVQGMQVLNAEKHLWCEKPLTCDIADTRQLVHLSEEKKLTLTEGFMYLYHPQFTYLQQCITEQHLGAVKSVTCRFGLPFLDNPGFRYSRSLGGGALFDVGSYTISMLLALFPDQSPVVCYADIYGNDAYEIDLEGSAKLCFSGGIAAYLEWGIGRGYRNEIDIWCEKGSLFTDRIFSKPSDYVPEFRIKNLNGVESVEQGVPANHFIYMFKHFSKIIVSDTLVRNERQRILQLACYLEEIRHAAQNI
ncbi:hypothetical protein GCAAIG_01065 [Candidatus Electronema halotolerans]